MCQHRNMGASMAQLVRGCTMVLLSSMVPTVINALGIHFLFFFHGVVCALVAIFVWKFVPETRGKTLLQLCSIFSESSFSTSSENQSSTMSSSVSQTSSDSLWLSTDTSQKKSAGFETVSSMGTEVDSSQSVWSQTGWSLKTKSCAVQNHKNHRKNNLIDFWNRNI